jgi:hypothetical protein
MILEAITHAHVLEEPNVFTTTGVSFSRDPDGAYGGSCDVQASAAQLVVGQG